MIGNKVITSARLKAVFDGFYYICVSFSTPPAATRYQLDRRHSTSAKYGELADKRDHATAATTITFPKSPVRPDGVRRALTSAASNLSSTYAAVVRGDTPPASPTSTNTPVDEHDNKKSAITTVNAVFSDDDEEEDEFCKAFPMPSSPPPRSHMQSFERVASLSKSLPLGAAPLPPLQPYSRKSRSRSQSGIRMHPLAPFSTAAIQGYYYQPDSGLPTPANEQKLQLAYYGAMSPVDWALGDFLDPAAPPTPTYLPTSASYTVL